jgi:hypothetical protein
VVAPVVAPDRAQVRASGSTRPVGFRSMALPDVAYRLIGWFSTTRFDRGLADDLYRRANGRGLT